MAIILEWEQRPAGASLSSVWFAFFLNPQLSKLNHLGVVANVVGGSFTLNVQFHLAFPLKAIKSQRISLTAAFFMIWLDWRAMKTRGIWPVWRGLDASAILQMSDNYVAFLLNGERQGVSKNICKNLQNNIALTKILCMLDFPFRFNYD